MTKLLVVPLLFFVVGCASTKQNTDKGDLIFYIKTTEGAFSGIKEKQEGFFFYKDRMGAIVGYEYDEGLVIDVFGGGSAIGELITAIEDIKLTNFDFHEELKKARERFDLENERRVASGDDENYVMAPFALDGAEYEIYADFLGTRFQFKAWNPGVDIKFYSEREENFRLLHDWMRGFTNFYGRTKMLY